MPLFDPADLPAPVAPPSDHLSPAAAHRLTKAILQRAAVKAAEILERTLGDRSMESLQVTAAKAILDRAGFGPGMSIAIDETQIDYSQLSQAQLLARLERAKREIEKREPSSSDEGMNDEVPLVAEPSIH